MSNSNSIDFDEIGGKVSSRALKVYWLIDVSGSMVGDKIATVNRAIRECIEPVQKEAEDHPDVRMYVRVLTFSSIAQWHTVETKIEDFVWSDLSADGLTVTGTALELMAQELTVEKMGKRALPPVIILMSDGEATDDYESGIKALLSERWGPKTVRVAIAIGQDANIDELSKFCSNPKENPPLKAEKASDLIRFIKWVSTEVPKSVSNSVIVNSDASTNIGAPPLPQVKIGASNQGNEDDAIF